MQDFRANIVLVELETAWARDGFGMRGHRNTLPGPHAVPERCAMSTSVSESRLPVFVHHVDLVLTEVDLRGGEQPPQPGKRFNGSNELPIGLFAASGQELPLPERHPGHEPEDVLRIDKDGRHPTEICPLG